MAYKASFGLPDETARENLQNFPWNYVPGNVLERLYKRAKEIARDVTLILDESLESYFGIDGGCMEVAYPVGSGEVEVLIHNLNSKANVLFVGFKHAAINGLLKILEEFSLDTKNVKIEEVD